MFRIASLATALLLAAAPLAAQDGVHVENAYALTSGPGAMSGAVFFEIVNHSASADDRLIAVSSDVAQRVELHTHLIDANGVARMVEVEDGFAVARARRTCSSAAATMSC
jgi:periplasmic copper chaperone A